MSARLCISKKVLHSMKEGMSTNRYRDAYLYLVPIPSEDTRLTSCSPSERNGWCILDKGYYAPFHQTTADETLETIEEENPFRPESKYLTKFGLLAAKLLLDSLRFFGIFFTIFKYR